MSSPKPSQSEYSADASGYVTARPRANPAPNQDRTVSDDLESHHDASTEPTTDSDSSESSPPVLPRPTPTMPESSRGPRIRVTARKSVPIPRRAFADRAETPAPPRVITGVPIGRVSGMTWAEELHFRVVSSGLQSCQARIPRRVALRAELACMIGGVVLVMPVLMILVVSYLGWFWISKVDSWLAFDKTFCSNEKYCLEVIMNYVF